jgi:uncharacterized protein (TIGR02145 family)
MSLKPKQVMKRFFTFLFAAAVGLTSTTTAIAQTVTVPYNPDGDANGLIGVTDLQDLLSTYGGAFAPGAIVVNSIELGEVLASLQAQINAFRCGDDVLHEGYWYNTTSIGGQCWFAQNVRYLPEVSPSSADSDVDPHAYVYDYQGTDVSEAQNTLKYHEYGALYNFAAVQQWNLCPVGWHVPTDLEWTEMTNSLGSENFAGNMMRTKYGDNWDGTNLSGFSGLPGGFRSSYNGSFGYAGDDGSWWSSSPDGSDAWYRSLGNGSEGVYRDLSSRRYGFSVRCVRDAE